MISACEARVRSTSLKLERNNKQLLEIEEAIEKAVSNGETKCFAYSPLTEPVRSHLTRLGYTVGGNDGRYNEVCIPISWG